MASLENLETVENDLESKAEEIDESKQELEEAQNKLAKIEEAISNIEDNEVKEKLEGNKESREQDVEAAKDKLQNLESDLDELESDYENMEQEKDLKMEYIYNNFDENYLPKRFFEENYPAIYDKDFWVDYIKNTPKEKMNYRNIEKNIIKRVEEINDNKWDIILGISNSRVQNIINIERDFILHYYAFGILGTILLLFVYIILLINNI